MLAFQCNFLFCPLPASFSMRPMSPLYYLWLDAVPSTLPFLALLLTSMFFFQRGRFDCQITETAHSRLPPSCFLLSPSPTLSSTCMSSSCARQPMPSSSLVLTMRSKSDRRQRPLLWLTFRFPNPFSHRLAQVINMDAFIHRPS